MHEQRAVTDVTQGNKKSKQANKQTKIKDLPWPSVGWLQKLFTTIITRAEDRAGEAEDVLSSLLQKLEL